MSSLQPVQDKISNLYEKGFTAVPPKSKVKLGDVYVMDDNGSLVEVTDLVLVTRRDTRIAAFVTPRAIEVHQAPSDFEVTHNAHHSIEEHANFELGPRGLPIKGSATYTYSFETGTNIVLSTMCARRTSIYSPPHLATALANNEEVKKLVALKLSGVNTDLRHLFWQHKRAYIVTEIIVCDRSYYTILENVKKTEGMELKLTATFHDTEVGGTVAVKSANKLTSSLTAAGEFVVAIKVTPFNLDDMKSFFTEIQLDTKVADIRAQEAEDADKLRTAKVTWVREDATMNFYELREEMPEGRMMRSARVEKRARLSERGVAKHTFQEPNSEDVAMISEYLTMKSQGLKEGKLVRSVAQD